VRGFDPRKTLVPKVYRRMSRISRMAVVASLEAMEDSGLQPDTLAGDRIGVVMGTSFGSSSRVDEFFSGLLEDGPRGGQPFLFQETVPNAPASHIAMVNGLTGPNSTFCQSGLSSENAVLYGRNLLLSDQADAVLVGGADELSAAQYACYDAIRALARIRVDHDGPVYPRPGAGLVLGEGAGVLVMERRENARKRGARIYGALQSAWVAGGGPELGHYEIEGSQMARAVRTALADAKIKPEKVDHVDVSANFSGELDQMEHDQLQKIFWNGGKSLKVTPLKYLMGEFGGAGAVRMAGALLNLHHGIGMPSVEIGVLNGDNPSPVRSETWKTPREKAPSTILMTSSTHGGGSCSMVFSRDAGDVRFA
jgi:3-oxoacyl-(acyl-carrier-protein) synthase